ncbi:MAG: outer membrane lipoprotein carrier protein LolA [Syntrophorhabdaceae bacterium]|nr:outer membrane lipoprotein carrier protein LolA [Syntrophorhabdaceae bacterium]
MNTRGLKGVKKGFLSIVISLFFLALEGLLLLPLCGEENPFAGIKKFYSGIHSLSAKFQQRILIASLKKERESAGNFLYKRGRGFLWEYDVPKGRFFLYDGQYIWQGDGERPYVQKERIDREKTGGTFFDLVYDISRIDDMFNLTERAKEKDLEVFTLTPKKDSMIRSTRIWVDGQHMVKKIEIREVTGNINIMTFSSVKVNQPVDEGRLVYKPNRDIEIIEKRGD